MCFFTLLILKTEPFPNLSSRLLLDSGADVNILTDEGERPVDLVDPGDMRTIAVMLGPLEKKKR